MRGAIHGAIAASLVCAAPSYADPSAALGSSAQSSNRKPVSVARFALILGVNRSVDADAAQLRYADDDAAKYLDLFRGLGARTYLLSRLDANTERLHSQASAEAHEPTRVELARALDQLQADVSLAAKRQLRTIVYVVYSGHGNVANGRAYLALEDARLFGSDLDHLIFDRIAATEYHVIVDACDSYLLAEPRGPGGKRREIHGFAAGGIRPRDNLGLLFSTSSARESHEWAGVEGGVFSHEVRSGLYGAADANGDGLVTYQEIVGFIQRANAAIPGERFRPDVYARPPRDGGELVDLRLASLRRIRIEANEHAHYQLEDAFGVQIAEFHNGADQRVDLVRPAESAPLYLKRVDDDLEFAVPNVEQVVNMSELVPEASKVAARGAASHAFSTLFSLPFGPGFVSPLPREASGTDGPTERAFSSRVAFGWSALGLGVLGVAGGVAAATSAVHASQSVNARTSQAEASAVDEKVATRHWQEELGFGLGAAAVLGGVTLLCWPESHHVELDADVSRVFLRGRF
jgi:hypothetical protein